jgi:hypothetical protein
LGGTDRDAAFKGKALACVAGDGGARFVRACASWGRAYKDVRTRAFERRLGSLCVTNTRDVVCHVGDTVCTCKACVADRCLGRGKKWICLSERQDLSECPNVPPALGAACGESVVCDYGYWEYGVAKRRICENGRWIGEIVQRE